MSSPADLPLAGWQNFYVIIAESGSALIGKQFVVMTLIANLRTRTDHAAINTFATPQVVHFGAALLIAATMSAPWTSRAWLSLALGLGGIAGLLYSFRVIGHAKGRMRYTPNKEDWFWYVALPCSFYALLMLAAVFTSQGAECGICLVAPVVLGLLFAAIHNAWDTVTHILTVTEEEEQAGVEQAPAGATT